MPNGDKIVQVPGVGNIQFPGTMDDAAINQTINEHLGKQSASKQQGAYQQKPGGPILNANTDPAPDSDNDKRLRGAASGLFEGLGVKEAATPGAVVKGTLQNFGTGVKDLTKGSYGEWQEGLQKESGGYIPRVVTAPFAAGMTPIEMIARIIEGSSRSLETTGGQASQAVKNKDLEALYHSLGSGAGQILALRGGGEGATGEVVPREGMQNVMNQGPAKAAFIDRQVGKAQAVQSQVKPALDALHNDGKQLMGNVSSHIDAVKPEGVFDKADVAAKVKDAMGVVKADQKVPSVIARLTESPEPAASKSPTIGGKPIDMKDPSQLKMYQKLKAGGAFSPEEIQSIEGKQEGEKISFEALKQMHSDLGAQIASQHGAVEAGVKTSYGKIGDMLRKEAESHGLLDQWQEGTQKVKLFNNIAYRSPLKDTYLGQNHGKIMRPLISDDLGPQVRPLLESIAPYGIDMKALDETIKGYKYGEKMDTLSEPSRMTPILAAISPKAAAIRTALPQMMRGETATNYLFGKGLDEVPSVKPKTVFPSKVAAAKELKGNATPFSPKGGINAQGVEQSSKPLNAERTVQSLSSEIDTMKEKLRNAGDKTPMGEKKAMQKQIDDYQSRLDDMRKGKQ